MEECRPAFSDKERPILYSRGQNDAWPHLQGLPAAGGARGLQARPRDLPRVLKDTGTSGTAVGLLGEPQGGLASRDSDSQQVGPAWPQGPGPRRPLGAGVPVTSLPEACAPHRIYESEPEQNPPFCLAWKQGPQGCWASGQGWAMQPRPLATGLPQGALGPHSPNSKWDERPITLADLRPNPRNLPARLPAKRGCPAWEAGTGAPVSPGKGGRQPGSVGVVVAAWPPTQAGLSAP